MIFNTGNALPLLYLIITSTCKAFWNECLWQSLLLWGMPLPLEERLQNKTLSSKEAPKKKLSCVGIWGEMAPFPLPRSSMKRETWRRDQNISAGSCKKDSKDIEKCTVQRTPSFLSFWPLDTGRLCCLGWRPAKCASVQVHTLYAHPPHRTPMLHTHTHHTPPHTAHTPTIPRAHTMHTCCAHTSHCTHTLCF